MRQLFLLFEKSTTFWDNPRTIQLKREQKSMSQEELQHYREKANGTKASKIF